MVITLFMFILKSSLIMKKLSILVPSDSAIERHLSNLSHLYRIVRVTSASVDFSYVGYLPPLAKISELLAMFEPSEYTISKSTMGVSFIVWSL